MKKFTVFLCSFLVFTLACGLARGYSETIVLEGGATAARTVSLAEGDEVSGRLTLVGDSISFYVSDPDNIIVLNYSNVTLTNFRFSAAKTGDYTFRFENLGSENTQHATFNYGVQHYILGFPQEIVLLFAICCLALFAIVVFALMSPKP